MVHSLLVGGRPLLAGLMLAIAAGLSLAGCSPSTKEATQQARNTFGEAAKTAANNAAQATLAGALAPVRDLLTKAEADVKAGNLAGAVSSMGGFEALWSTAAPVIQPMAGDKWPAIEAAAKQVLDTFSAGSPTASKAEAAISGLMGTLNALRAK